MYCDAKQWDSMQKEVFTTAIWFDASSAGAGEPRNMEAKDVCKMWEDGFSGLDAVHHLAGHYLITVQGDTADIFGYAVATHYKKETTQGNTRTFTGSYDLKAERSPHGWRLSQFNRVVSSRIGVHDYEIIFSSHACHIAVAYLLCRLY